MTDIASLGLELKSDPVLQGTDRLKNLESQAGRTESAVQRLITMTLKFASAYASWRVVEATVSKFITSTVEAERVQAQLTAALRSTGAVAGQTVEALNAHAEALKQITIFDDEAINGAQALLLTFTRIRGDVFPQATEAVLDLATAMGTDLRSAALQVGKALNDPILGMTTLSRAGVQFTDEQKRMVKQLVESNDLIGAQAIILKELETQFGGSAQAARDTLGGALTALGNAFDDMFEAVGPQSDMLQQSVEDLIDVFQSPDFIGAVQGFGSTILGMIGTVAQGIVAAWGQLERFLNWLKSQSDAAEAPDAIRTRLAEERARLGTIQGEGNIRRTQQGVDNLEDRLAAAIKATWTAARNDVGMNSVDKGADTSRTPFTPVDLGQTDDQLKAAEKAAAQLEKTYDRMAKSIGPLLKSANDPMLELQSNMDTLGALLNAGQISWEQYGEAANRANLNATSSVLGSVGQITGILSDMFEDNKLLAAANAAINTAEGVTKALAQGGMFAWPTAIAIGLSGAAQIAAIMSASPKGGTVAPVSTPATPTPAATGSQQAINLTVRGSGNINVDDFAKQLEESIRDGGQGSLIRVIRAA